MLVLISSGVVAIDQLTKWMISRSLSFYEEISVIPGLLKIIHIHNPGGAFGIFASHNGSIRTIMFIGIASIAMCGILYLYKNTPKEYPVFLIGLALIFGGALGNIIDRIRIGRVIDFIDFYIGSIHWPAFNVADSAITVGMFIFAFYIFVKKVPV